MGLTAIEMFKDKPLLGHGLKVLDSFARKSLIKSIYLIIIISDLTVEIIHIIHIYN